MEKIELIRTGINDINELRYIISDIDNYDSSIIKLQLCVRSSLIKKEFINEIKSVPIKCENLILRIEVDDEINHNDIDESFGVVNQFVLIAGNDEYASEIERYCNIKGYNCKNFTSKLKGIPSWEYRKQKDRIELLTEKKLIKILSEYADIKSTNIDDLDDDKGVILVSIQAGLAQQIFFYLLACRLSELTDKTIILNDCLNAIWYDPSNNESVIAPFVTDFHVSYERAKAAVEEERKAVGHFYYEKLEFASVFGSKFKLLSDYFTNEEWSEFINKAGKERYNQLSEILESRGISMYVVRDHTVKDTDNNLITNLTEIDLKRVYEDDVEFIKEFNKLLNSNNIRNLLFEGNGGSVDLSQLSLLSKRDWVKKQISCPPIKGEHNIQLIKRMKDNYSVVIHYRRGGMYHLRSIDDSYYKKAIQKLVEIDKNNKFRYYVFSDALSWCKEHGEELGFDIIRDRIEYVEGNTGADSYLDLLVMSNADCIVLSPRSAFSVCAVLLGDCDSYVDARYYINEGDIRIVELNHN